jgi:hypothetical protein
MLIAPCPRQFHVEQMRHGVLVEHTRYRYGSRGRRIGPIRQQVACHAKVVHTAGYRPE